MRNYLELGKWNVICDRCGRQYKNDALRKEWTGLMVCDGCFETRHEQTLIRPPREENTIPWSRPEPDEIFASVSDFISTEDNQPIMPQTGPELPLQTES